MKQSLSLFTILFVFQISILAQENILELKAQIVDESNSPIAFATIYSKTLKEGTISRIDGKFSIKTVLNDSLECSALSYSKQVVSSSQILQGDSVIIMKKKAYMLADVNVMEQRWYDFKHKVLNSTAKQENKNVMQVGGLPDIYRKTVEFGPYAGISNPISLVLIYFSKAQINKRQQNRWRRIYQQSLEEKGDTIFGLQKKSTAVDSLILHEIKNP